MTKRSVADAKDGGELGPTLGAGLEPFSHANPMLTPKPAAVAASAAVEADAPLPKGWKEKISRTTGA